MTATGLSARERAIQAITSRPARLAPTNNLNGDGAKPHPVSEYFGINTFGAPQMRAKLPDHVYAKLVSSIKHGKNLDSDIAPTVAQVMKE